MAYEFGDYTAVRAVLGVSASELPDTSLTPSVFHKKLSLDLQALGADILTDYAAASLLVTTAAVNFVAALDIFATYAFASYCISGFPQFSLKSITDGKASQSRYAVSPLREMIANISTALYEARQSLSALYATYLGEVPTAETPRTLLVASDPDADTITTGV